MTPGSSARRSTRPRLTTKKSKTPASVKRTAMNGSGAASLNAPFTTARAVLPPWVPFPVAFLLAGGGILATIPIRRQRRLLSEGRPAPGLVVKHGKAQRDSHGRQIGEKYYYEFPLLSGALAKGEAGPRKNPPAIGSVVPVIYDPDEPPRNAPYPLSLVRLADLR